ncbi:VanZ family protein [Streptomyces sp. NPDC097617]|uniref:VanZ family protein n=1 Tax=Streptomyces sp. NPDC097617 TaxID=3366091 RepID=UPI003824BE4D
MVELWLVRVRGLPKVPAVLFGWAVAGALSATLYPSHTGASASGICTIGRDVFTPLLAQQGIMNVALFVPAAFFSVLVFRRPAVSVASGVLLSAGIESVQALTSSIGRSCTSEDLIANSLGTAIGVALALALRGMRSALGKADLVQGLRILGVGAVVLLAFGAVAITPVLSEVTELTRATSAQQEVARRTVRDVWGPDARISSIQYMKGEGAAAGQTLVTLEDGFLNFTDGAVNITGSRQAKSLPGVTAKPVRTKEEAVAQAAVFVQARFPWALKDSTTMVDPTTADSGQQTVGWRQRVDGVLMPMRMDVVVDPDGRISAFTGRNELGPAAPPAHRVTAEEARRTAEAQVSAGSFAGSEILVQKNAQGDWETRWLISFTLPRPEGTPAPAGEDVPVNDQGTTVAINALTGKVIPPNR